ncbi:MAG TPA: PSD1 and planctomycete cytochrome C domain-containing protein [Pirellulaceae bacterium]|nr:PSD1 and planctomycete cytochrome C domain-containing protein [Pirellulaceae bacterium]
MLWLGMGLFAAATAEPDPEQAKLPPPAEREVDFVRDIQPIFAQRCNHCHGEDEQEGYLRLDAKAVVMKGGKSGPLLEVGKSADSVLVHRLAGLGTEKRMPLEDDPLSDEQIGLIRAWIDQGAKWPDGVGSAATSVKLHWAYVAPVNPELPSVRDAAWCENPVDRFVLARLEQERIAPSPVIDRERLIRRASLDLIGLPPSVDEVDAFLADESPDAYERLLDRLLASPRYGERWATPWLDAARYADSNGYQRDGHRTIWPYRDYVIQALNADLPFDQFTIEQIAGDLLPEATLEQKIATGFHRCTTVNVEAGTDEEENRTNQIIDRVNVTGTVWLGTTLECCQCHNHKYDPFTQRDYYRLYAFFNSTPKETYQRTKGSAALDFGGPELTLPLEEQVAKERAGIAARRQQVATELEQCLEDEATGLAAWELEMSDSAKADEVQLPANIRKLLEVPANKRKANQSNQLRSYFVGQHAAAKKMQAEMDELQKQLDALAPAATLVMADLDEPRMTTILKRGNFLDPGEAVQLGTPRILPGLSGGEAESRLDLAKWLVDPANPLTPRVQVNRAWAQFFGRGMVASEEDLGTQSEPPTHPELLDWLAVELRDRGWSLKRIHRRIAESATYRQSSRFRSDLAARDPENLLLARGPRMRLSAEAIRDNALAVAGSLSAKMHGPPVYPPQPEGVWRVTGLVDNTYRTSPGDDAHRRGVYTVRRRSAPYPSFSNFDAPDRSACVVKRPRSNTPLQALTLQNDPVYVELAAALADKLLAETPTRRVSEGGTPTRSVSEADMPTRSVSEADIPTRSVSEADIPTRSVSEGISDEQLVYAFRTVLTRRPEAAELSHLRKLFDDAQSRYASDPKAAQQLRGKRPLPEGVDSAAWAAWFNVAHVLLNLDETITKN